MKFEFPSLFTRQATRNGYFVVLDLLEHNMNSSHKDIYWHWKERMILTPIQSLLALTHYCCIIGREITNASIRGREITNASIRTSFFVFGLIRRQIEPMFSELTSMMTDTPSMLSCTTHVYLLSIFKFVVLCMI